MIECSEIMEPYHREPETFEWETLVTRVKDGKFVTLKKSYFYPKGGGQPEDLGTLITEEGTEYPVIFVGKFGGTVSHQVDTEDKPVLEEGMVVTCKIDEERRRRLMRGHTAAHIVSELIARKTGAEITGNQLSPEKVRIDFSTPEFNPDAFAGFIDEANEVIARDMPVLSDEVTREEMDKDPALSKLAMGFPEHIKQVRIVHIEGFDKQACGGTHVANTKEIGSVRLLKVENKGAKNRRVYFTID